MDGWLIAGLVWGSGRKIEGRVVSSLLGCAMVGAMR